MKRSKLMVLLCVMSLMVSTFSPAVVYAEAPGNRAWAIEEAEVAESEKIIDVSDSETQALRTDERAESEADLESGASLETGENTGTEAADETADAAETEAAETEAAETEEKSETDVSAETGENTGTDAAKETEAPAETETAETETAEETEETEELDIEETHPVLTESTPADTITEKEVFQYLLTCKWEDGSHVTALQAAAIMGYIEGDDGANFNWGVRAQYIELNAKAFGTTYRASGYLDPGKFAYAVDHDILTKQDFCKSDYYGLNETFYKEYGSTSSVGLYGYGLLCWTSDVDGRKGELYDYCKAHNFSIGSVKGQLSFIVSSMTALFFLPNGSDYGTFKSSEDLDKVVYAFVHGYIKPANMPAENSSVYENALRITESYAGGITAFVTRLYEVCLDRTPDSSGLASWTDQIESGKKSGIQVAYGFIFSKEFKGHNYCNACYVEHLYNAFLGRTADSAGKANWVAQLEAGKSREEVFNGFAMSSEFFKICANSGIIRGQKMTFSTATAGQMKACSACGAQDQVSLFVIRLYHVCLDRTPDAAGLSNWVIKLRSKAMSGYEVTRGFYFSSEFRGKNYDDTEYLNYLYKGLFDRNADGAGRAGWQAYLNAGASRMQVFRGYIGSQEYIRMCKSYGINPGEARILGKCYHVSDNSEIGGTELGAKGSGLLAIASAISAYSTSVTPESVFAAANDILDDGWSASGITNSDITALASHYGYKETYAAEGGNQGSHVEEALSEYRKRVDDGRKTFMILLLGGTAAGAADNPWVSESTYIAIVDYRVQKDGSVEYQIKNPMDQSCGWHTAADFEQYVDACHVFLT